MTRSIDQVLAGLRAWIRSGTPRSEVLEVTGLSAPNLSRYLAGERRPTEAVAQELGNKIPARFFPQEPRDPTAAPRVFVSSTFLDNVDRRKRVQEAILAVGAVPLNMENWSASTQTPLSLSLDKLRNADVLVGILAYRYGHIPEGQKHSLSELEYSYAEERGIDRLMFLIDETKVPALMEEFDSGPDRWEKQAARERFKQRIAKTGGTAVTFNDETLGMKVMQALHDWISQRRPQAVPASTVPVPKLSSAVLAPYYDRVIAELGQIRIAGFVTPIRGRIDLAALCVPLGLAHAHGHVVDQAGKAFRGYRDQFGLRRPKSGDLEHENQGSQPDPEHQEQPITLALALQELFETSSSLRIIVLLGHPGAGKTTFQKQVAVKLAQDGPKASGLPNDVVPIFIELRALSDQHRSLDDLITDRLNALAPHLEPDLSDVLVTKRLLLLLDGLDEVPRARRSEVRDWIATYTGQDSPHRAIVTCRFMGYTSDSRFNEDHRAMVLEVLPLRTDQRNQLIRNWYNVVEHSEVGSPKPGSPEHARAKKLAQEGSELLIQSLEDGRSTPLYELSVNPLLLSALCVIHRDRKARLPERRVDLYSESVDGLLELWRGRQDLPFFLSLTARQARQVLEPVALWMHTGGRTSASIEDTSEGGFVDTLDKAMRKALVPAGLSPQAFLTTIRDESGLITGLSGEEFGFLHLRFQEYLASCELRRSLLRRAGDSQAFSQVVQEQLVDRFQEPWWKEVLASLFADPESEPLFRSFHSRMLKKPLSVAQREQYKHLIADTPYFDPEPFLPFATEPKRGTSEAQMSLHTPKSFRTLAIQILRARAPELIGSTTTASPASPLTSYSADTITGLTFVGIPAGDFMMGSPKDEEGRYGGEWRPHRVHVPAFEMAVTPVTNAQYGRYLADVKSVEPPACWGDERYNQPDQPVVGVSWEEAVAYCRWAEGKLNDGSRIRLPSEAEWEYACRAGAKSRFWSGDKNDDLVEVGWFDQNSGGVLHAAAEKQPNQFGLHDMHGNVWEWCLDWICNEGSKHAKAVAAQHPAPCEKKHRSDPLRVVRGGSFGHEAKLARSAYRVGLPPDYRDTVLGFRPVRVTP